MSGTHGYALVTGAGQGIGRAIALELARNGFGILATARTAAALDSLRTEASALNGGRVRTVALDLLSPGAVDTLEQAVNGLDAPLVALVNNAGQGLWGLFDDLTAEEQHRMMRLNMDLPVLLTHRFLPRLRTQPEAYILNIASMVAYHALASMAVYSGSKAFVLRWSRSLRLELAGTNVKVTCVCPGSVITGFTERAGMQAMDDLAVKFGTGPEPVANTAVKAMLAGKAEVVPGLMNRVTAGLQGLLPSALIERIASGIYLKRLPRR
jgi:short-subunit dehydrogenase